MLVLLQNTGASLGSALIGILTVFVILFMITAILYVFRLLSPSARREAQAEKNSDTNKVADENQIPEELLLAIITAAVTAVLEQEEKTSFRVVSFRRIYH